MPETATSQTKAGGRLTNPVVDLAVLNLIVGGGLVSAAIFLFLLRHLPLFTYQQQRTVSAIAFWIGAIGSLMTVAGFALRGKMGWTASLRLFVVATGIAAFASGVVEIGLVAWWDPAVLLALSGIGVAILVAGVAMLRGRRWGGFIELAIMVAPALALFIAEARVPSVDRIPWSVDVVLSLVLLLPLVASLDPLMTIFESPGHVRFAAQRFASRNIFPTLVSVTLLLWVLMSTKGLPGLVNSMQTSRQKRSMAEMSAIMQAVEKYGEANGVYPPTQNVAALAHLLEACCIKGMPRNDPWGHPYDYHRVTSPSGEEGFVIRTAGCDGIFEQKDPTAYTDGGVIGMHRDIVFSTVSKPQWPEGLMPP
ncbi:MAG: type II secretion system protein GspG [Acidobacteriota bacterium]